MPVVRSYFRRSPGAAAAMTVELPASDRLDVAVYDAGGSMVRDPSGGRWRASNLSFSTGLPGGFEEASFVVTGPSARLWPLESGHRLIIRRGRQIVWWGWIEDVSRQYAAVTTQLNVQGLGPWQVIRQRVSSPTYTDVTSSAILITEMGLSCPEISRDASRIVDSRTPLSIDWDMKPLSDMVKAVCDTGDDQSRPLLFAVWEPAGAKTQVGNTGNLTYDWQLEQQGVEWYFLLGAEGSTWAGTYVHSGRYAAAMSDDGADAVASIDKLPVAPSATYVLEYWHYWSAHSGMTNNGRVDWYTASNVFISSSYLATYTATGASSTWTQRQGTVTSPGTAATARVMVEVDNHGASKWTVIDDIRFYLAVSSLAADTKPRARLWARDLTDFDYLLWTSRLLDGVKDVTSTRDLANSVVASYGSSSFTAAAQDLASQALYRKRESVVAAGSVGLVDAEAVRDTYLATYRSPRDEFNAFRAQRGTITTRYGRPVCLAMVRAGDRLKIADGPARGTVLMLTQTSWQDGILQCTPETQPDVPLLLAR